MGSLRFCEGWDRSFLKVSSYMAEPSCMIYGLLRYRLVAPLDPKKFENCDKRTQEVAFRVLIVLATVLAFPLVLGALALGAVSKIFRSIGFFLQKGGYTYVQGARAEKILDREDPRAKVTTWNICAVAAKMSLDHGGVIDWRKRLDGIVQKIRDEDADVLVLQEVYDIGCAELLAQKLLSDYAHFFIHLGPNALGSNGGCFVATKCAVHHFSHTSFKNNSWVLNRGFADLEIKADPDDTRGCIRVVGTHLIHGDNNENRKEQIEQIVSYLEEKEDPMPTALVGDLNMERDAEGEYLNTYVDHGDFEDFPTCTGRLQIQWDPKDLTVVLDERLDYISLFKTSIGEDRTLPVTEGELTDCHFIEAFSPLYDTKAALSDHRGLSAIVKKV